MVDSRRAALAALLFLPAGLTVLLAFDSGGFFPGPPAYTAVVLCVVLLLRVTLAKSPAAGCGRWMLGVTAALALYALLMLLSQIWSHAPGRAVVEFNRTLVYVLAVALFGSLAADGRHLRWVLRALALATVGICVCALITRLLPHLWPTMPDLGGSRLEFPLTYWNALGLMAAYGIVLSLQLSSDPGESAVIRVLAAAAAPVLATTLYFTFSRGGVAAALVGVVVVMIVGRPRAALSAILATAPTTALAITVAYNANLLAGDTPTSPSAVAQGQHVAAALVICAVISGCTRAALAWQLDGRLARLALPRPSRRLRLIGASGLAVGVVLAALALHPVVTHEYQRFVRPGSAGNAADLRTRLTDPSSDGRLAYWRVAWRQFQAAPALGHGAGTFETAWAQFRPTAIDALDAHSVYLETLAELGIVGLLLPLAFIIAVLFRAASKVATRDRLPYTTAFALILVWALHAGIDWDWEMPAVTLPIFAVCGFVLARPADARPEPVSPTWLRTTRSLPLRALAAIGCMSLAVLPAITWLSQRRLDQAAAAFASGNCQAAERSAAASISILNIRPEAYEVLGYCAARRGMPASAIAAVHKAISLDPNNWNFRYDLAVMRACAGLNPMPDARRAASLNPLEPLVQDALWTFGRDGPTQWKRDGEKIANAFTTL